jgi:hypothetical protein
MPDARLGLAAYELAEPAETTSSFDLPWRYEYEGHVWSWTGSAKGSVPGTVGTSANGDDGLALVALDLNGPTRYRIRVDGEVQALSRSLGGGMDEVPLLGGQSIAVEILDDRRGDVTIALYERVD